MKTKCEICGIETKLTKHHLIPRVKCHNKYKKIENDESNFIMICNECHRTIHAYFSETELRDKFNTIERLMSNEKFAAYVNWRHKHPNYQFNSTKMSNSRKQY